MLCRLRSAPISFSRQRKAFYRAYWAHAANLLGAELVDLGNDYFRVFLGNGSTLVHYHYVNLDTYFNKFLADEKPFISWMVRDLGYRAPRFMEYTLREIEAAGHFMHGEVGGTCVVKPTSESGGRGVTTGIRHWSRLVEASLHASRSLALPALMLEEQVEGESYRLLYLHDELLHAVQRGRCTVIGDGVASIERLVALENQSRQKEPEVQSLTALTIDLEMQYTLADQGLSLHSVPRAGECITVKNVTNQNARRDQRAVTHQVHPAYHQLAAQVSRRLGTHLFGLDVIARDIADNPQTSGGAVIEINIPPGLHYHELVPGSLGWSDVGARILACLLAPAETRAAPCERAAV